MSTPAEVIRYFEQRGLPSHVATGIVANLLAESQLDPMAVGDKGTAFGVAQWRGPRLAKLRQFARNTKRDWKALDTQLDFVLHELQTDERRAFELLQRAGTPEEATVLFARHYERPGKPNYEKRIRLARSLLGETQGAEQSGKSGWGEHTPSFIEWLGEKVGEFIGPTPAEAGPLPERPVARVLRRAFSGKLHDIDKSALEEILNNVGWAYQRIDSWHPSEGAFGRVMRVTTDPKTLMQTGFIPPRRGPFTGFVEDMLIERGFTPEQVRHFQKHGLPEGMWRELGYADEAATRDVPGLYWATCPEIDDLSFLPPYHRYGTRTIVGVTRPGAKIATAMTGRDLTDYDFLARLGELIQLKPGNVLAKYGPYWKIIGGAGLATGAALSTLAPDKAEAKTPLRISGMRKFIHGVLDPEEARQILKSGLKRGSSISRTEGWDYPIRLHIEHWDPVDVVEHHPDHYLTTSGARIKKVEVDASAFVSEEYWKNVIKKLEDEGEELIERLEAKGVNTADPKQLADNPEFLAWSKKYDRALRELEFLQAERKARGWPPFEESLKKLQEEAAERGIPVELLTGAGLVTGAALGATAGTAEAAWGTEKQEEVQRRLEEYISERYGVRPDTPFELGELETELVRSAEEKGLGPRILGLSLPEWALAFGTGGIVHAGTRMLLSRFGLHALNILARSLPMLTAEAFVSGALFQTERELLHSLGLVEFEGDEARLTPRERIAHEALAWGLFPPALSLTGRAVGKTAKGLMRATDVAVSRPLRHLSDKYWAPIANKLWDKATLIVDVRLPLTDKTTRELFQRGVERIRRHTPPVGRIFDIGQSLRYTTGEIAAELSRKLKELNPTERHQLIKSLQSGIRGDVTPRVEAALNDIQLFASAGAGRDPEFVYRSALTNELHKFITGPLENLAAMFPEEESAERAFETAKAIVDRVVDKLREAAGSDTKKALKLISEEIRNPLTPEPVKKYLLHLYNLPATFPSAVRRASTKGMLDYISSEMLREGLLVSLKPREGFVFSKHPQFRGLYVHRDVELELDAIKQLPRYARRTYTRMFISRWKVNKVLLRPSAWARNLYSNIILNDFGGLPFYRLDVYNKALREMYSKSPLYREFIELGGRSGRFSDAELAEFVRTAQHGENIFDKLGRLYDTFTHPARGIYSAMETWAKLSKYIHNLERGMTKHDAVVDAMKWTFNYGEVTPLVAAVRSHVLGVPFFTWWTKSIPLFIETCVKHPLRVAKWVAFGEAIMAYALETNGLSETEWQAIKQDLPKHMQSGLWLLVPFRDEKGRIRLLNLTWMIPGIGDIAELYQRGVTNPWGLFVQSPIVGGAAALLTRHSEVGAPIWYEWEKPTTKAAKALSFLWKWWAPAPAPGGVDWKLAEDMLAGRPDAQTPMEVLASQMGFRVTPIDRTALRRRAIAVEKIYEQEISSQFRRDLRRATSPEERRKVIERYREDIRRLYHPNP